MFIFSCLFTIPKINLGFPNAIWLFKHGLTGSKMRIFRVIAIWIRKYLFGSPCIFQKSKILKIAFLDLHKEWEYTKVRIWKEFINFMRWNPKYSWFFHMTIWLQGTVTEMYCLFQSLCTFVFVRLGSRQRPILGKCKTKIMNLCTSNPFFFGILSYSFLLLHPWVFQFSIVGKYVCIPEVIHFM